MTSDLERYEGFMSHLPEETKDKSLIALKGHLLLETCLREYIYNRVPHPERLRKKQHTFAVLIDFASSLQNDSKIEWVWKALRKANQIRNQLAHQLEPKELDTLEQDFITYVEDRDGEFSVRTDKPLKYEKLALVYFQVFDVLVRAISVKGEIPEESIARLKRAKDSMGLSGLLANVIFQHDKQQHVYKKYGPRHSKKKKRVW